MPKTKISEFSATPANNTDIDSINIAEGCAPSGINDAIRELMAQLKDFQTGAQGDSFGGPINGTIGATTPNTGAFTTLTTTGTINLLTVGRGAGAVSNNTAVGANALRDNTTGESNTAIGFQALRDTTTGTQNTASGVEALVATTTASNNTAVGYKAAYTNTTGANNTALGLEALRSNTTASNNTAVGYQAGYSNTTGSELTAIGHTALRSNTTGIDNTALGWAALYTNTTGSNNTALGKQTFAYSTTASYNTAVGYQAGFSNTTGSYNTLVGYAAGYSISGSGNTLNTFIGQAAGYNVTTGTKNTFLGTYNGNQNGLNLSTASNYIVLSDGDGNPRGIFNSTGIFANPPAYSNTTGNAANLYMGSTGVLERSTSSLKYKTDVQNATHGLAEVLQLRPVTYKGKRENDGDKVFGGLVAEEVHAAGLTEFVQYAEDGSPDALAYGNMVSLAFKAIQELKAEFDAYKASHP